MKRNLAVGFAICTILAVSVGAEVRLAVDRPTPLSHYTDYDVDKATLELMGKVMSDLDPQTRDRVMKFMSGGQEAKDLPKLAPDEALKMVRAMGLEKYKVELLEVFLHKSEVMDVIPEKYRESFQPIFHDAMLAFMDGLSDERSAERLMTLARLPPDTPRGEKILVLASKIPTLQKVGQTFARMEGIPPDISLALQSLENQISTMTRDELVSFIVADAGEETIRKHQIEFAGKILAEASVGAVIRATYIPEGHTERDEIVCKLIKPYVSTGLPREMEIIDRLIELADKYAEFYHLEGIPLKDMFTGIKAKLGEELLVTQEQANFRRAYDYYAGHRSVRVPKVYPFSTKNVTFMEFLEGEKINEAFKGDPRKRATMARLLVEDMTYESLFSKAPIAVFHGDPHAGNVLHVTEDPAEPYTIGLLDWGLLGKFDRAHRIEMVQLSLALKHKDKKKLHKNVGALLDEGMPEEPARRERVIALADECLKLEGDTFQVYGDLIQKLLTNGFVLDQNLALYIKSQLTLAGIYKELDPNLHSEKYTEKLTRNQVLKEFPKRLLLLPAWNYRGYRSLLSNGDVFSEMFR